MSGVHVSRCSHVVKAKKCTKMCDAHAKLLFCQSKPIAFLPFLLSSPLLLLKLPNIIISIELRLAMPTTIVGNE